MTWNREILDREKFRIKQPNHPITSIEDMLSLKEGNALDIGCGKGSEMKRLTDTGKWKTVGIDVNTNRLKMAKMYGNVTIASGDVLPFKDESFDIVLIIHVLHHAKNPEIILSEGHRVLKKDGYLILAEVVEDNPIFKFGRNIRPWYDRDRILSRYKSENIRKIINISGYEIIYEYSEGFIWPILNLLMDISKVHMIVPIHIPIYFIRRLENILLSKTTNKMNCYYYCLAKRY